MATSGRGKDTRAGPRCRPAAASMPDPCPYYTPPVVPRTKQPLTHCVGGYKKRRESGDFSSRRPSDAVVHLLLRSAVQGAIVAGHFMRRLILASVVVLTAA